LLLLLLKDIIPQRFIALSRTSTFTLRVPPVAGTHGKNNFLQKLPVAVFARNYFSHECPPQAGFSAVEQMIEKFGVTHL
jgi:hypothetical protein